MKQVHGRSILVTGATGFIGEHLVRSLGGTNQSVVGLGHQHSLTVPGISIVQLDLGRSDEIDPLVEKVRPSVVFHCAAETNAAYCQQHADEARSSIVKATENLVAAVRQHVPEAVVVGLSTDLVFDGRRAPYREGDRAEPLSVYGHLKLEAESSVLSLRYGMVLRTSLVYGPRTTHKRSFLAWMIDTLGRGESLSLFEDEVRTPIHKSDLCRAMLAMAQKRESGLWHVGGPHRLNRVAMGQEVCSVFGFDPALIQSERLADSTYGAPRPSDVSLDSSVIWSLINHHPMRFALGLEQLAPINSI